MSNNKSLQEFHHRCNAAIEKRRKRKSIPLQTDRTFVDDLRDKLEWIKEEYELRKTSLDDVKWITWASGRIREIESELEVFNA